MVTAAQARSGENASRRLVCVNVATLMLVVVSAFAVIHSTHACRKLYASLQELESSQWYLQEDYGRLLLEQSAWASHYRVEKVARAELGMKSPQLDRLQVVLK